MLRQYQAVDLTPLAERLRLENKRAVQWTVVVLAVSYVLLISLCLISGMSGPNLLSLLSYTGLFPLFVVDGIHRNRRRRAVLRQIKQALVQAADRTTLEPTLTIRAACRPYFIPDFEANQVRGICEKHLRHQLPRATDAELHQLTPEARIHLIDLLKATLKSPHSRRGKTLIPASQELVVAILLALASLKQPGGEESARRCLNYYESETLSEAAREYLKAIGQ